MRNRYFLALAVALVVGLVVQDAQARPGGKGPGRPGGGARPGGLRSGPIRPGGQIGQQGFGNLGGKLQPLGGGNVAGNLKNGNFQNKVSQLKTNFTSANQPFTPAWYADHPRAWQYTHPHADAWAVATFGAAATWLGLTAASGGTVYTAETEGDQAQDDENAVDTSAGDFLPLGVFALAPKSEKDASALVQLAVNKQGELRGNYYDVVTGKDQAVAGKLDKQTQRATFKVFSGGSVSFETTLASLTQSTGSVKLVFDNGPSRQWTLARFDSPAQQTK
ncbi:MAG: hypothetical protein WD063_04085 [Pirellulales bacterium]